jgi:protein ImuB
MMDLRIACIRIPLPRSALPDAEGRAALAGALLSACPRVTPVEEHPLAFWGDASGLGRRGGDGRVAGDLLAAAAACGFRARVGVAGCCVAAAAATRGSGSPWRVVPRGEEGAFLARFPLRLLPLDEELREGLALLGLRHCGQLAALEPAGVELRFGAAGLCAWRLARGDDPRAPFRPPPTELPSAEVELETPVSSVEPIRFVLRGLLGAVQEQSARRQRIPAALRLRIRLEEGGEIARELRPARPTGEERTWGEIARLELERLAGEGVDSAVTGITLETLAEGDGRADQLDLFRRAAPDPLAMHAALAPLLARWGEEAFVHAVPRGAHLPGDAGSWVAAGLPGGELSPVSAREVEGDAPRTAGASLPLALRLHPSPHPLQVREGPAGCPLATRSADGGGRWRGVTAVGPERLSGAWWAESYAREYWIGEEEGEGRLLLLYRDAASRGWFEEGWYD